MERSAPRIVACGILLVLVATLLPFNFTFQDSLDIKAIAKLFRTKSNLTDWLGNLLLFIPFGFGLACLSQKSNTQLCSKILVQTDAGTRGHGDAEKMNVLPLNSTWYKLRGIVLIIGVLVASFSLSLTVELLQAFLPGRAPTGSDLLLNSISGLLGFWVFHRWRTKVLSSPVVRVEATSKRLWLPQLTVSWFGYLIFAIAISLALQTGTNLSNWDDSFPLLLGNETTGDRPWQGSIAQLSLVSQALSQGEVASLFAAPRNPNRNNAQEGATFSLTKQGNRGRREEEPSFSKDILADYQLVGQGNYQDQTKQLPDLVWQYSEKPGFSSGQQLNIRISPQETRFLDQEQGVSLSPNHWLATTEPATLISQQLRTTSEFTLSATIATADITQMGIGRIISLSGGPYHRNFTLAQQGTDLILRLRTPLMGENGTMPPLVVPQVFVDTDFHHLIITYDGSVLQFYLDQISRLSSVDLKSGLFLLYLLKFPDWNTPFHVTDGALYRFVYYGIIFIPLGVMMTLIFRRIGLQEGRRQEAGGRRQEAEGRRQKAGGRREESLSSKLFKLFSLVGYCRRTALIGGMVLPALILESILAMSINRVMNPGNLLISIVITGVTMLVCKVLTRWIPSDLQ
ncbi:MAG: hypothetical protein F6K47_17470 [Symploca sp. SIO2E6]|nr:hypothetical protein [Symploca sp. SIO2E6]